ncbi:acetyl-CoA carboxylase biotin carboxyl carrier protein subunit [Candidatus Binatus sp.]|jgi:biotin carboxyl carrier protein|uniref:acetyl-CoA carboxylase biotin carboxyl carrier protein subunit n=1 Tax=Candidatus Binatus sp. TaxID=2811406 RepID=UPI003CB0B3A6
MKLTREGDSHEIDAEVISRDSSTIRVRIGGREVIAEFSPNADGGGILALGGQRYQIFGARRKESIFVSVGPASFEFRPAEAAARRRARGLAAAEITAPMPGKVLKVLVRDGDLVEAGQALVVIEAMKMETTLAAESAALVKHVRVEEGQTVDHGAVLIELSPPPPASSGRESGPLES